VKHGHHFIFIPTRAITHHRDSVFGLSVQVYMHPYTCDQVLKVCKHDILLQTACGDFTKFTT